MPVELITVSDYARRRGCDEKAVRKAIESERITAIERDGKRLIDPEVANIQWARNTRARAGSAAAAPAPGEAATSAPPSAASPPPPQASGDYQNARARREHAEAEEAEIRVALAAGRALDRQRAERAVFDAFRQIRDAWFAANQTSAQKVLGMTEEQAIRQALDDEARSSLADWEQRLVARLQEAAGP
jgi:signal transduction protein with GAF and PtsI domain